MTPPYKLKAAGRTSLLKCATQIPIKGVAQVGLQLSSTKSVVLATCKYVALNVAKASRTDGKRVLNRRRHNKMLGVSITGVARRCTTSLKARLGATESKAPRVAVLRRQALARLYGRESLATPPRRHKART